MSKVKIKSGLASLIIVLTMFAGWEATLITCVLMLLFCELEDNTKNLMSTVLTFVAGIALFTIVWNLLVSAVGLITGSFDGIIDFFNYYLVDKIQLAKVHSYVIYPITKLVSIADNIVDFLVTLTKCLFIFAVILNKPMKENFATKKISMYVEKFMNFVSKEDK